jgi:hypothetical protein
MRAFSSTAAMRQPAASARGEQTQATREKLQRYTYGRLGLFVSHAQDAISDRNV